MESANKKPLKFIKDFWLEYEPKIVLLIGLILVAALSFEFGLMQGKNRQISPLIIEKTALAQNQSPEGVPGSALEAPKTATEAKLASIETKTPAQKCAFIGSKNSNKYHLPTCRWAKQIKPENIVCFASAEEATAKSYQPDKNCIK